ncbi:DUF3078 domain-containing protein [Flavobacterium sp. HSC-61S13]|uniref:DUF3078 domain-containing protein n=1 Tax=Flavobacterium sp. HSC-61S13 TaxID=2910963 RepID=UPI0020A00DFF|nr:DUF3078 domain-containing protein [Flavobacterium sp. HSC-61S13]MCP1995134.1 hypothetical protein [Flavobacterium sp. HSC-61S13]
MKKITFSLMMLFATLGANAQEVVSDSQVGPWTSKGTFSLLGNQSSFTNWQAGGDNNFAGTLGINYDINYKSEEWNWDNKIQVNYGISKIKGSDSQKTDDRFEFNSLVGKKAAGYWFYSAFLNFKTQMDAGMDPKDKEVRNSHFFSPAYLQIGPGMLWKKSDNLKVNFAPATSKFIFVHDHFTEFGPAFGVEQGDNMRYELGASISGYYKATLMENVSIENILNLYSNYLEDPQNVDIDYQLNVVLKINKYLSTNFSVQTIYDDNSYQGFQIRQAVGVGLNYTF